MRENIPPAIDRKYTEDDRETTVISKFSSSVTHHRGWGDSGNIHETVEHECPDCSFDRMVRVQKVSPEFPTRVRYWCLNPNCTHFVRTQVSHATHGSYPQRTATEPKVTE